MPRLRVIAVVTTLLLAGCAASNAPAPTAATPMTSSATPASTAPTTTQQATLFGTGACLPLAQWQAEGKRLLTVSGTEASPESGETPPFGMHLTLTLDGKAVTGQIMLPDVDPAAIVVDDQDLQQQAQVCDGHVFIVNLAEEHGGVLVIGNLIDNTLAMTSMAYASGDEDTATVAFKDGSVMVTDRSGSVRLQEQAVADAGTPAHGLVAESTQCEHDTPQGHTWLKLLLNSDGSVRGMDYTSTMPGGASCTVSAGLVGDEASLSQGKNVTDIRWEDNEDPSQASYMRVSRNGDVYTLEPMRYDHPQFCGQSAQLADTIQLRRNVATCTAVRWPK